MTLTGPYSSLNSYRLGRTTAAQEVPVAEFLSWSDDANFPQLPDHPGALRLFRKLRKHPRLDRQTDRPHPSLYYRRWRARPLQGDLNATADKHRFILDAGASAMTSESARTGNSTPQPTSTDSSSTAGRAP